jgi:hypothetical protein
MDAIEQQLCLGQGGGERIAQFMSGAAQKIDGNATF